MQHPVGEMTRRSRPMTLMAAALGLVLLSATDSMAGNCPNANPNDNKSDSSALQFCLNTLNTVQLDPGSPGYIVSTTLEITRNNQIITSSQKPTRVRILAGRNLFAHMLQTQLGNPRSGFTIEFVTFHGGVDLRATDGTPWRKRRDSCVAADNKHPGNVVLEGTNFIVRRSEFLQALCGSGLAIIGERFTIEDNTISQNGRDKFAPRSAGGAPWADGLTLLKCQDSFVRRNKLEDNTDVALIVGGGHRCMVNNNTIRQKKKFAFAGLHIGRFVYPGHVFEGDHLGSEFKNNLIETTAADRLGMGILVGAHPFSRSVKVTHSGKVVNNTVRKAAINLAVDGTQNGEVTRNTAAGHRGTENYGTCRLSHDYVANTREGSAVLLQPDPVRMEFHDQVCTLF